MIIAVLSFLVSVGIFLFTFICGVGRAEDLRRRNQYLADLTLNEDPIPEEPDHEKFWLGLIVLGLLFFGKWITLLVMIPAYLAGRTYGQLTTLERG